MTVRASALLLWAATLLGLDQMSCERSQTAPSKREGNGVAAIGADLTVVVALAGGRMQVYPPSSSYPM